MNSLGNVLAWCIVIAVSIIVAAIMLIYGFLDGLIHSLFQ